ncbi:ligand-effect modulator 3 family [Phaeosphaeriaceae sp. PMI808]|nr:ligand-effect modulator 3 family [Phaeosphaeriaceae sp. PMI808]
MSQAPPAEHTDSISSQDPTREEHKKTKSRRPPNTAFRQQRLKAWQPILTPKTVLPLFFIVGVIFAPIGGLLLYASSQVQELSIDYTNCITESPLTEATADPSKESTLKEIPSGRVAATFNKAMTTNPMWGHAKDTQEFKFSGLKKEVDVCILQITIPNEVKPPILFYYRLTNFYQNHRRYVKSVDVEQLKGKFRSDADIRSGDCAPLNIAPNGRPYYPCGLIANSMFNDTFGNLNFTSANNQDAKSYDFTTAGTSWTHEGDLYGKTAYKPTDVAVPPYWQEQYPETGYDNLTELPNLHNWEEFQVWMRTAGLPTFSKLYQRNDNEVLKEGTYRLKIYDHFPVQRYSGTKSILISTRTVMGGKNPFLGIAYIVVGGLCILLGAVFLATHLIKPRKLGDHTYLTWNNDEPSTATTTGRNAGGA